MTLSYTLTLDDYKAALRLHRQQKFVRILAIVIWPILTGLCSVGAIAFNATGHHELFGDCMAIGMGSLWLTIFLPVARFFNARKCFKRLFLSSSPDRNLTVDINDERIISAVPGVSEGKFFWNAIIEFVQNEKVTLLYVAKARFLFIPTPVMSPEQRSELNDLVARHVVRQ